VTKLGSLLKSGIRRQAVDIGADALVQITVPDAAPPIPCVIEPAVADFDLVAWAAANRAQVAELLQTHRALLFRNGGISTPARFQAFVAATSSGELLEYVDRSTPRREVETRVYTSTEYPAEEAIALHNEGTYWLRWPLKIYFCCIQPPDEGGETPIADTRAVLRRLPDAVVERFRERQVLYVRNYNDGCGLPWQSVFQTDDPAAVEDHCRRNRIEVEWKSGGRLRTRQRRKAIATHPVTQEPVWFNHAAFFHVSSLAPDVRDALLRDFGEDGLPYNTYYGDGSPIEPDALEAMRAAYQAERVAFPWRRGDVLLLDNMSVAHARNPYRGPRQILASMVEPVGQID
jgi:alpha-ketoglutarate-dependent taurine dioxygenase